MLDIALGIALAALLASTTGAWFAERSVATFHVGQPGTWWRGPVPMAIALAGALVYGIPFATWLVFAAAPLLGATPGQSLLGLRTVTACGGAPSAGARWQRFLLKTAPWGLATAGLAAGQWILVAAGGIALAAGAAGLVRAAVRDDGNAWWDTLSGTRLRRGTGAGDSAVVGDTTGAGNSVSSGRGGA